MGYTDYRVFLKIDGIKGESHDSKHKGEIDILGFGWGAVQSGVQARGGGGAGKVGFEDVHIVKKTDASSPLLMRVCANGRHLKEANIVVRGTQHKGAGSDTDFLTITLNDVLVSSFREHAKTIKSADNAPGVGTDPIPLEELRLNGARFLVSRSFRSIASALQ